MRPKLFLFTVSIPLNKNENDYILSINHWSIKGDKMSPRKPSTKDLTKEMIINEAHKQFITKDFQQVSMRSIAKELGCVMGLLFFMPLAFPIKIGKNSICDV